MAEVLKRVVGPVQLGTGVATVYTVPVNKQFIIRNIHIANTGGSDQPVTISIGADAASKRIWPGRKCIANDVDGGSFNIPVEAAEIIQAFAGAATVTLVISGVLIDV